MKTKSIAEFGDFQTPLALAARACARLAAVRPRSIIEPTCGRGSFVQAATLAFPGAERVLGFEINPEHLRHACEAISDGAGRVTLKQADFFAQDWTQVLRPDWGPWLVIGNPPWVTSAELGSIASTNLPEKSNFQARKGFDAITGKANFDISEWMLLQLLNGLAGQAGTVAVLCKTAVARKVLSQVWADKRPVTSAEMFKIDALSEFGAAVDACLFVLELGHHATIRECLVYDSLESAAPIQVIGFDGHGLISNLLGYERTKELGGNDPKYVWRSGIKHDCSKIMELRGDGSSTLTNGLDEAVCIERELRLPFLKSSDIGNGRTTPRGEMVITQKFVGQDTSYIESKFPIAWRYLSSHRELLDRRKSSIYLKNPQFSIFGVGGYTFSPWKVAISGFYKKLTFVVVGPSGDRPVVFDDTVYFLSCSSEEEARFIHELLSSSVAQDFYSSIIHWDEKRPITVGLLKRLSLRKVAEKLGMVAMYEKFDGSLAFAKAA